MCCRRQWLTNSVIQEPSIVDIDESAFDCGFFNFSFRNVMRAILLLARTELALLELMRLRDSSSPSIGKANRAAVSENGITVDGH